MDANEVIRGRAARGDGYGGVVDQQHSVVVALELKAFGGKDVCGLRRWGEEMWLQSECERGLG